MQKWFPKAYYKQAVRHAIEVARELNGRFDVGLEAFAEYGRPGYRSGFILPRPENRQGFELRCEVLRASDPLPAEDVLLRA